MKPNQIARVLVVVGMLVGLNFVAAMPANGPGEAPGKALQTDPGILDHFRCYTASGQQPRDEVVDLRDQFDLRKDVRVRNVTGFCNPAEKIHDGKVTRIANPDGHLTRYFIQGNGTAERTVLVSNQFGTDQPLKVSQPFALLVPTRKLPHPRPTGLDHFQCYKASGASANTMVILRDQFNVEPDVLVFEPFALCNPVEKNHAGVVTPILNPKAHLVCYYVQGFPFSGTVETENQFGRDFLGVWDPRELCVPSEKRVGGEGLDHFKCYLTFSFRANDFVLLRDQFGENGAWVQSPVLFCNPVAKVHGAAVTPINNPDAHLKMYRLLVPGRNPFGLPDDQRLPDRVTVSNQFGKDQDLKVQRLLFLAVPTQKLPHAPPRGLDHFACYSVTGAPADAVVGLRDQFRDDPQVRVLDPLLLCNPAQKTHRGQVTPVEHPRDHLVCYRIYTTSFRGLVVTVNQFGQEFLPLGRALVLCVPSGKRTPPPQYPNIQKLCGERSVGDFDGGNVLPGGPGTGLYRDNPDATWPDGRPRRPCGKFVPIDGADFTLTAAGATRFRIAYRAAGDPVPALGTAPGIATKWNLWEWDGFACTTDAGPFELATDGSPQEWMDASDYLDAKSGLMTGCGNSGLRWAVWDSNNEMGLGPADPNGHYVVWVEWDDGVLHREPFEHHVQLDNVFPVINDLEVRLQDGVTVLDPCGEAAAGASTFQVWADFGDQYYWRYILRVAGGAPPTWVYYGWHNYYDGTPEVANTGLTGTTPPATTVFLRDIDMTDLGPSFVDCCYILELWVEDASIRHSFNNIAANEYGPGSFLDYAFQTFAASP